MPLDTYIFLNKAKMSYNSEGVIISLCETDLARCLSLKSSVSKYNTGNYLVENWERQETDLARLDNTQVCTISMQINTPCAPIYKSNRSREYASWRPTLLALLALFIVLEKQIK
jgi:hypothetical protein